MSEDLREAGPINAREVASLEKMSKMIPDLAKSDDLDQFRIAKLQSIVTGLFYINIMQR